MFLESKKSNAYETILHTFQILDSSNFIGECYNNRIYSLKSPPSAYSINKYNIEVF